MNHVAGILDAFGQKPGLLPQEAVKS